MPLSPFPDTDTRLMEAIAAWQAPLFRGTYTDPDGTRAQHIYRHGRVIKRGRRNEVAVQIAVRLIELRTGLYIMESAYVLDDVRVTATPILQAHALPSGEPGVTFELPDLRRWAAGLVLTGQAPSLAVRQVVLNASEATFINWSATLSAMKLRGTQLPELNLSPHFYDSLDTLVDLATPREALRNALEFFLHAELVS